MSKKMDVRYREIALQAPAEVVDKALDRKREIMLHLDFSEQLQFLDDAEAGILMRGLFAFYDENRGRKLSEYTAPACIVEAQKKNRVIGMVWSIWSQKMLDDMMRYVATSIVRSKVGTEGGKKSAALRAAQAPEEKERIRQELAEMERKAWDEAGEEAEKSADREREELARDWQSGINPITGELRPGYEFPTEEPEDDGDDDDAPDYPEAFD